MNCIDPDPLMFFISNLPLKDIFHLWVEFTGGYIWPLGFLRPEKSHHLDQVHDGTIFPTGFSQSIYLHDL